MPLAAAAPDLVLFLAKQLRRSVERYDGRARNDAANEAVLRNLVLGRHAFA